MPWLGDAEAGQESARHNSVYFTNQEDQGCSSEQSITIARVRDNVAKENELGKNRGKIVTIGDNNEESGNGQKGSHRKRPKNVVNWGEAGPSVGNRSVGGVHLQHFLGNHFQLDDLSGHRRRSQGIPDVSC